MSSGKKDELRVLQVVVGTDRRGAETFAVDLQASLRSLGATVRTVALAPGEHDVGHHIEVLGPTRLSFATLRRLRSLAHGHDVVVAHGSTTLPACGSALVATKTPFLYRNIGDPGYWVTRRASRLRSRALLRRAAGVVCLWSGSAHALCELHGLDPRRLHVIPNAVPAERITCADRERRARARQELGLAPGRTVTTYLGSFTPEKDVASAVLAVAMLEGVELLLAGAGPLEPELRALAASHLGERARFLGSVPNPSSVLAASDVLVLPSRTEGMPGVLIEAGLSGIPAVATDVGGVSEIVVDGVTGHLVPAGEPAALRDGIVRALARRDALGRAARARCQAMFTMEDVGARWMDVLLAVATEP